MSRERIDQIKHMIIKEAGIKSMAINLGKRALKNPLNTALTGASVVGTVGGAIGAGRRELMAPMQKFPKVANDEDLSMPVNRHIRYLPYAASAAALAMYGAEAYKKKSLTAPFVTFGKGVKEYTPKVLRSIWKKNPLTALGSAILRRAKGYSEGERRKAQDLARHIHKYKKDYVFPAAGDKKLIEWYRKQKSNPAIQNTLRHLADEEAKRRAETLNKALAAGAAFGTGNFLIHSLADQYFDSKDSQRGLAVVRKTREDDPMKYSGLSKVHKRQRAFDAPEKKNILRTRDFQKEAAVSQQTLETAKRIFKEDVLDTLQKSLIFTATPALVGNAINRNLRGNFSKIRDRDNPLAVNNNRVVIEIPLEELNKKKAFDYESFEKEAKAEVLKSVLGNTGRQALRALAWVAPPTALAYLTGRNFRGSLERIDDSKLGPVEPGKARIIIETNRGDDITAGSEYYASGLSRSASDTKVEMFKEALDLNKIKKSLKKIVDSGEWNKVKKRKERTLRTMDLSQGVRGRQRMQK